MTRKLITITNASKIVGVSRRTMYNWLYQGKVEYIRIASGSIRIYEDSLFRDKDDKNVEHHNRLRGYAERRHNQAQNKESN